MGDHCLHNKRFLIFLLGLILINTGCLKEIPETFPTAYEWNPAVAFPIGEAEFGLKVPYGFDTLLLQLDTAGFQVWSTLDEIPLQGSIDFNFSEVLGVRDELEYFILRVNTYNGFPTEGRIQAFLMDNGGNVVDSLFDPRHAMDRGRIDSPGETAIPAHNQADIFFDSSRLDLLLQVKRMEFEGSMSNVSSFPDYTFGVQIAGVAGVRYQFN